MKIARGNGFKFLMKFIYWFATFILSSTLLTGWCSMQTFGTCDIKPNLSNVVPHSHMKAHVCLFLNVSYRYHCDTVSSFSGRCNRQHGLHEICLA